MGFYADLLVEPNMRWYLSSQVNRDFFLAAAVDAQMPYGVITKISPGKQYTHSDTELWISRMQCSCYGETYPDAKAMAGEVKDAMSEWAAAEDNVQAVFLANEIDLDYENIYHTALDFLVWHTFSGV